MQSVVLLLCLAVAVVGGEVVDSTNACKICFRQMLEGADCDKTPIPEETTEKPTPTCPDPDHYGSVDFYNSSEEVHVGEPVLRLPVLSCCTTLPEKYQKMNLFSKVFTYVTAFGVPVGYAAHKLPNCEGPREFKFYNNSEHHVHYLYYNVVSFVWFFSTPLECPDPVEYGRVVFITREPGQPDRSRMRQLSTCCDNLSNDGTMEPNKFPLYSIKYGGQVGDGTSGFKTYKSRDCEGPGTLMTNYDENQMIHTNHTPNSIASFHWFVGQRPG